MGCRGRICTALWLVTSCGGGDDGAGCPTCAVDAGLDAALDNDGGDSSCLAIVGENEPQFRITSFHATRTDCTFGADAPELLAGTLDVSLASYYFVTARLENLLPNGVTTQQVRFARRLDGTCIPDGGELQKSASTLLPSDVEIAVFVLTSSSETLGPKTLVVAIEGREPAADRSIHTPIAELPLTVCDGCLKNDLGPCDSVTPPFSIPCYPGVNEAIDCCTEVGGALRCPP